MLRSEASQHGEISELFSDSLSNKKISKLLDILLFSLRASFILKEKGVRTMVVSRQTSTVSNYSKLVKAFLIGSTVVGVLFGIYMQIMGMMLDARR